MPADAEPSSETDPVKLGQEALKRLTGRSRDWDDWRAVGAALLAGRKEALRSVGRIEPSGKRYNERFGKWLHDHGFDEEAGLESSTRTKLLWLLERIDAVEERLALATPAERAALNHPRSVEEWYRRGRGRKDPDERAYEAEGGNGPGAAVTTGKSEDLNSALMAAAVKVEALVAPLLERAKEEEALDEVDPATVKQVRAAAEGFSELAALLAERFPEATAKRQGRQVRTPRRKAA